MNLIVVGFGLGVAFCILLFAAVHFIEKGER
mgnify:CR=1 FL=1